MKDGLSRKCRHREGKCSSTGAPARYRQDMCRSFLHKQGKRETWRRETQSFSLCFSSNIRTAVMGLTKQTRKQRQMGLTEWHLFHKSWNWLARIRTTAVKVSGVCAVTAVDMRAPAAMSHSAHTERSPCHPRLLQPRTYNATASRVPKRALRVRCQ